MKKFLEISFLLLAFILCTELKGQSQKIYVLQKNEIFTAPEDNTVVMDASTFCAYHYTAAQCDTLKGEIEKYDSAMQCQEKIRDSIELEYSNLLSLKDSAIKDFSAGYEKVKSTLVSEIDNNTRLQVDYQKLENKNRKVKRWRNIFMGASALFGGIIVLAVTH